MTNFICVTCGVQFAERNSPPAHCPICEDERQYIAASGQQWTRLPELRKNHRNRIEKQEDQLYGIGTEPKFAIGQRALLVQTAKGNLLWDCISLIDDKTVEKIHQLGGIQTIAISHPHYYASAVEWAQAFDADLYLHEADREWVMRPDDAIQFWHGSRLELQEGLTLIHTGGHFEGGTVCHWASGTKGRGTLLTGDIIQVVADKRWVSFMYSYPNLIPLPASRVKRIAKTVQTYTFDRLYGAWWDATIMSHAKEAVTRSAERYIKALEPVQNLLHDM